MYPQDPVVDDGCFVQSLLYVDADRLACWPPAFPLKPVAGGQSETRGLNPHVGSPDFNPSTPNEGRNLKLENECQWGEPFSVRPN